MVCEHCHALNEDEAHYCSRCGSSLELFSKKSRMTALILCIVFGTLGVHRAYLGKWWTGILQCVTFSIPIALGILSFPWKLSTALLVELCVFGIILFGNAIWVVIDASRIVSGTMTDALGNRIDR